MSYEQNKHDILAALANAKAAMLSDEIAAAIGRSLVLVNRTLKAMIDERAVFVVKGPRHFRAVRLAGQSYDRAMCVMRKRAKVVLEKAAAANAGHVVEKGRRKPAFSGTLAILSPPPAAPEPTVRKIKGENGVTHVRFSDEHKSGDGLRAKAPRGGLQSGFSSLNW